ncbi:YihY/virulence factor BrkB family protein [Sphingobacterium puteale]|uniref:YihY/virulence factor BrkB family protein n=2 Tax=Sphingobacterium TaxID=28453 RepID=A0A363NLP0_9SPHI|nr:MULTISPECIES: YihY/virulence factor BrkB family protein [Sphingobacterium]PUV21695.1 YihY/virulence factor BrkB family protein [Sphingobacterium athyrii]QIH35752.1 YihY/virulence factor BrkB family protein [Sphingobacterium sp. DR205]RKO69956.1 YihY/virulence factor BrkB family protein [Sphingobacterium puteale]
MGKFHQWLLNFEPYFRLIEWSKRVVLPGFGSLPLYTVAVFFFQELSRDSIVSKASSLSYSFLLAIFPGIIFLFTLIPYIPINNFQEQLLDFLAVVIPKNAFLVVETTLEDIIKNQNGGLLSFGFLFAAYFATNGMASLMNAFNKASLMTEKRPWLRKRLIALTLAFLIIFALTVGMTIFTIAGVTIDYLKETTGIKSSMWATLLKLARWIIIFAIYFFTVSCIYKFGPSTSNRWKLFSPGASMATILAILTFSIFTFYINHFGAYNKLYGSIGTLIVIMLWIYLNTLILLLGYELNAAIALSKQTIVIAKPRIFNSFKKDSE